MYKFPPYISNFSVKQEAPDTLQLGCNRPPILVRQGEVTMTIEGYFTCNMDEGTVQLKNINCEDSVFLLNCTESEMEQIKNYLDMIRS